MKNNFSKTNPQSLHCFTLYNLDYALSSPPPFPTVQFLSAFSPLMILSPQGEHLPVRDAAKEHVWMPRCGLTP